MINYPPALKAVGGARTGIAPVNLLDVLTLNNDLYLFSDRLISGVPAVINPLGAIPVVPPVFPIPAGQGMVWSLPTQFQSGFNPPAGSATAGISSAELNMYFSGPFVGVPAWAQWWGWTTPAVPAGATVVGIYGVILCEGTGEDTSLVTNILPAQGAPYQISGTGLGGVSGQASRQVMGASLSDLASIYVGVNIWSTVPANPNLGSVTVSWVGLAVYYTLPSGAPGEPEIPASGIPPASYLPWLMSVPQIAFHRSMQTDFGNFVLQNVSGDTLSRDFEKLMRRATLDGAMFVYRLWQADAQASWLEVHGTLTVDDVGVDTVSLKGTQLLNPAQDDTPMFQYCETCQLQWAGPRCGATGTTECQYSYPTCQVPERILVVLNDYEKNYGESLANVAIRPINRARKI